MADHEARCSKEEHECVPEDSVLNAQHANRSATFDGISYRHSRGCGWQLFRGVAEMLRGEELARMRKSSQTIGCDDAGDLPRD